MAAVRISLSVVLVAEVPSDAGYGGAANLIARLGRPRVVDHALGLRHDRAQECDVAAIARPARISRAFWQRADLLRLAQRKVEGEDLVGGAALADKGDPPAVGRPLG